MITNWFFRVSYQGFIEGNVEQSKYSKINE